MCSLAFHIPMLGRFLLVACLCGIALAISCPDGFYPTTVYQYGVSVETCKLCPPGCYCNNNFMYSCSPGTWREMEGGTSYSDCTSCGPGKSSPQEATSSSQCFMCPEGKYQPDTGSCYTCSSGVTGTDHSSCTSCNAGEYRSPDRTVCVSTCPAGYFAESGSCVECPAGTYKDSAGVGACTLCPSPTTSGPGRASVCTDLCPVGTHYIVDQGCVDCPIGTYNDGTGLTGDCPPCELGTYQPNTGQSSCEDVPDNFQSTDRIGLTPCPAGTAGDGTTCDDCVAGKFSNEGEACQLCPKSQYQPLEGKTSCVTCDEPNVTGMDHASCAPCTGSDVPSADFEFCVSCALHEFWDGTACRECEEGFYCDGYYQKICDPGTYSAAGATQCEKCPAGKGSDATRTGCVDCTNGYYSTEGSDCMKCALATNAEHTSCYECDTPAFVGGDGQVGCVEIPDGHYMNPDPSNGAPYADTARDNYWDCTPGHYCTDGVSHDCEAGMVAPRYYLSKCELCPAGQTASADHSTCIFCTANTYSTAEMALCELCEDNVDSKHTKCFSCPSNMLIGTDGCLQADDGDLVVEHKLVARCPQGFKCLNGTAIPCNNGYYQYNTGKSTCLKCDDGFITNVNQMTCDDCLSKTPTMVDGALVCMPCPGTKIGRHGICYDCPAGYECSADGVTKCEEGSVSPEGASSCTPCETGIAARSGDKCLPRCGPGLRYVGLGVEEADSNYCMKVENGWYSPADDNGQYQCTGLMIATKNQDGCMECYSSNAFIADDHSCVPCDHEYVPHERGWWCVKCIGGTGGFIGSSDLGCVCPEGTAYDSYSGECTACSKLRGVCQMTEYGSELVSECPPDMYISKESVCTTCPPGEVCEDYKPASSSHGGTFALIGVGAVIVLGGLGFVISRRKKVVHPKASVEIV